MAEYNNIKVTWEDSVENYSQEKERAIIRYFQKKYNTKYIKLIFNPIRTDINVGEMDIKADASELILDTAYQRQLMKRYIEINGYETNFDFLVRLDDRVNNTLSTKRELLTHYKKFSLNKLELANFLSFAPEKQIIDFKKLEGVTIVSSNPPNFGGKCVRSDTKIKIQYDLEKIKEKLGFIPDELK